MLPPTKQTPPATERLRFRHMVPEDAERIAELLLDREAMQHYPVEYTREDADGWVTRNIERYARGELGLWAIERLSDGQFVGDCGLRLITGQVPVLRSNVSAAGLFAERGKLTPEPLPDGSQQYAGAAFLEVGYHFLPRFWGHGYATEAASECIRFAHEELEVERVFSMILRVNQPSRAVARRAGMSTVGSVLYFEIEHELWAR